MGEWGKDTINPFLARAKREKKSRAKKNGSAAGGGAALELRALRSGASKQLTIFFEIRSNFSKNERNYQMKSCKFDLSRLGQGKV